ncbi:aminotransferase class V-fold PLP-dependent enzyme [Dethiobacter alkaliphilus]|uniref:aminotransferase class V-fold PLP-dependent enzyme n=1 Tax=Dethiobacter alkaliphilus TaxID=427926 RepID=UPI0022260C46|nr:aminotransferase class V-fold PLP-dependent enzyme [Dethiobacter alkaliphilus]MCW3490727.1 aminotransferase class V-fold PLP-dependent enzyme [Dethiobacter alkaliphilus]
MQEIYADHGATTYPRPPQVIDEMIHYMRDIGCSPGRGGYAKALDAARMVYETRHLLACLFNVPTPEQVIFTPNVTYSLNMAIKGLLKEGDHVLISSMEHNAVVRPLTSLASEKNITVKQLPCAADGSLDPRQVKKALRPQTRLVILTHASNVAGTILPVYEIGEILQQTNTFFCVDAAQTAGSEVVDFTALHCDYLAFTGHKGLLGPPGIGGLCLSERAVSVTAPLVEGGTGSRSEEETQPDFLPDKFESGTQNVPGIAGLAAGIRLINEVGRENIRKEKYRLTAQFLAGLAEIPEITVHGINDPDKMVATISINIDGIDNGDLSFMLEQGYGIMTRSGLHCAPLAHKTLGTFPQGTLRFSFGYGNTPEQINSILQALQEIVKER